MKKKFKHRTLSVREAKKVQEEASEITLHSLVSMSSIVERAREMISKDITFEEVWIVILTTMLVVEKDLQHNGEVAEGNLYDEKGVLLMSYCVDKNTPCEEWEVYVSTHCLVAVYGFLLIDNKY